MSLLLPCSKSTNGAEAVAGGPGGSEEIDDDYDDDYTAFWSCDQLSCQNGGQCVSTQAEGGVRCNCKLGFAGPYCNEGKLLVTQVSDEW